MEKSNKIIFLSSFVLVGFFFSIVFHYVLNVYFQLPDNLFGHFVWPIRSGFFEFFNGLATAENIFNPFSNTQLTYFPFSYIFLLPFTFIKIPLFSYFAYFLFVLSAFIFFNLKFLSCKELPKGQNFQNIFVLTFFSYPFLMALDFGTVNLLLFAIFALVCYYFYLENFLLCSIILSFLSAANPLFIVFSGLFLTRKNYRYFFLSVFLSFLFLVSGFLLIGLNPFEQIFSLITSYNENIITFTYHLKNTTNISSLYMLVYDVYHKLPYFISLKTFICAYDIILALFAGLTLFSSVKEKTFWKKFLLFILLINLIPIFIFDYNWLFLFIPIWFFVNSEEKHSFDLAYTILFGLLLLPKSFGIYLNPLLSIVFILAIIFEQHRKRGG